MVMLGNLFFPNFSFYYALSRNQVFWGLVNINNELVPVRRQHGNGKPHRSARLVERSSEYLVNSNSPILGQAKENGFRRIRPPNRDPVPDIPPAVGRGYPPGISRCRLRYPRLG